MNNVHSGAKWISKGVALGVLLLVQTGAEAQKNARAAIDHAWFEDPIVGVWNVSMSYFSEGTAEIYDPFGNLLVIGCSRATATRFE